MQNQLQLANLAEMQQRGLSMHGLLQQQLDQRQQNYGDHRDLISALARQQQGRNSGQNFSRPVQQQQQSMNFQQQQSNTGFSNHDQFRNLPGRHANHTLHEALQQQQQQQRQQKSPFAVLQEEHEVRCV